MERYIQIQGLRLYHIQERQINGVTRHFFTHIEGCKLFLGILNDLTGELPILEIPIYITDRTTKRMLRTNRMKSCGKDLFFWHPVSRRS